MEQLLEKWPMAPCWIPNPRDDNEYSDQFKPFLGRGMSIKRIPINFYKEVKKRLDDRNRDWKVIRKGGRREANLLHKISQELPEDLHTILYVCVKNHWQKQELNGIEKPHKGFFSVGDIVFKVQDRNDDMFFQPLIDSRRHNPGEHYPIQKYMRECKNEYDVWRITNITENGNIMGRKMEKNLIDKTFMIRKDVTVGIKYFEVHDVKHGRSRRLEYGQYTILKNDEIFLEPFWI